MSDTLRHCAFCFISIEKEAIKLCGKCNRRAYCSKRCQTIDWNPNNPKYRIAESRGQGHKNWCQLNCGEEDLDWKIVPIEGKGLGIIALRDFSAKSKILVEGHLGYYSNAGYQTETMNLMPEEYGTSVEKFSLNRMGRDPEDKEVNFRCFKMYRVNHACDPNANHTYDDVLKVKILWAERDIKAGEEICITYFYKSFPSLDNKMSAVARFSFTIKWGIDCPPNCFCRDPEILKGKDEAKDLDSKVLLFASSGQTERALEAVQQLLVLHEVIHSSLMDKRRTYYDGFQIAVRKRKHFPEARKYIQELYDIMSCTSHPSSPNMLKCEMWKKDLSTHHDYLRDEGGRNADMQRMIRTFGNM